MASEGDMAAVKTELVKLDATVKTIQERLVTQLDPNTTKYDER